MSDLKKLVQELLAHDPSKEQELRKIYPDAFKPEYFQFGDNFEISTAYRSPVYVGQGIPPLELRHKCLVVDSDYHAEIIEYNGDQLITFKKKP